MQLHDPAAARVLMEAVDVLGDDAEQPCLGFEARQRRVGRVGPGPREVGVRLLLVTPVALPRLRAAAELLDRHRAVATPDPPGAAEVRHVGGSADAGAGERHCPPAALHETAGAVESFHMLP